jgi:hypothetical protein
MAADLLLFGAVLVSEDLGPERSVCLRLDIERQTRVNLYPEENSRCNFCRTETASQTGVCRSSSPDGFSNLSFGEARLSMSK